MERKKVLLLVLGIVAIFGGFSFYAVRLEREADWEYNRSLFRQFSEMRENDRKSNTADDDYRRKIRETPCTESDCLTPTSNGEVYGIGSITGYYTLVTRDWVPPSIDGKSSEAEKVSCDAFTITSKTGGLVKYLNMIEDQGENTISRNERGQLIINLPGLGEDDRKSLLNSSFDQQVELTLLKRNSNGYRESNFTASKCFSYLKVLKLNLLPVDKTEDVSFCGIVHRVSTKFLKGVNIARRIAQITNKDQDNDLCREINGVDLSEKLTVAIGESVVGDPEYTPNTYFVHVGPSRFVVRGNNIYIIGGFDGSETLYGTLR